MSYDHHQNNRSTKREVEIANTPNLGYMFYKDYYRELNFRQLHVDKEVYQTKLKTANDRFFSKTTTQYAQHAEMLAVKTPNAFHLTTTYPGLLIGTGYIHESGFLGEMKLGFYFDHTTGLPLIPGSSLKGTLRSMFPNLDETEKEEKTVYIQSVIEEVSEGKINLTKEQVSDLEKNIFEGFDAKADNGEDKMNSLYERDIFYDAIIYIPASVDKDKMFLGGDYITPHKNPKGKKELDAFSNPIPLHFLKIMPDIEIRFQFKLRPTKIGEFEISAKVKEDLFQTILMDIGIGAKTNVGYGQLV